MTTAGTAGLTDQPMSPSFAIEDMRMFTFGKYLAESPLMLSPNVETSYVVDQCVKAERDDTAPPPMLQ